ncbi:MarR family transcriptional regulator [Crossiella sp. CA-258035]|uniref:MarR family winged helix-turn-helix transcriptional regulator n=1 Tax=Crossiella sp. CA-258035 TaxID=2981138 RepID=UPI0024BD1D85|nr:MarR family transcriptional regulator [Crossiella sp. CA-258035]WHT15643.1 MarR family transcriptional regulator [Crossiella sp. CA-258035]
MRQNLSFTLHVLTARLDRAADRLLRAEHNVSYRRFLALTLVKELGTPTQRALADTLGVTEPSVSRMTAVLAEDGLLDVQPDPAGGRRKLLSLTEEGDRLVTSVQRDFEKRFAKLVAHSGVPYGEYAEQTERLLATLDHLWTEKGTR